MKNRISILGCGWVGFPLAKDLVKQGYSVNGSTTSPEKLELLKQQHIDSFLVQLAPNLVTNKKGFFECDTIIIAVPPKKDPEAYWIQMQSVIKAIETCKVKQVIYISSTSVYGNNNREENEETTAIPDTLSGKAIKLIEDQLFSNPNFKTTVIRFAGLVGPGRHPGRFLSGKKEISNGLGPVNLIHLDDCIGLISAVLRTEYFGRIINACAPDHPSRKDFYTLAAHMSGLVKPEFIDELKEWKIINSICVPHLLNYDFKIKDWKKWLLSSME
jgi:nucleoside-diphosphate-sugar epimerase